MASTSSTPASIPFPLPARFLPQIALTPDEVHGYRTAANEIVAKTLEQEIEFRYEHKGEIDATMWKFVKAKDHLKVYKRIAPPARSVARSIHAAFGSSPSCSDSSNSTSTSSQSTRSGRRTASSASEQSAASQPQPPHTVPMLVVTGKVAGRLEDLLYGGHHKTTDEMRITTSFLNKHHLDSAVLHTIESGSDADPFRYLGIKWRIAETPGGNLISNRDVSVLEFVGTSVDAMGQRFGFHVIKSIDAPWFPELPDPHIVRARMMLCCIYRQLEPAVVTCYMKGVFDLGGDLIDLLAYNTAADTLLGIARTVECAEAKKLTLRLILEQKRRLKSVAPRASHRRHSTQSTASTDGFSVDRTATVSTEHSNQEEGQEDEETVGHDDICSVCHKKRSTLSKIGSSWDRCRVCRGATCSKCHVRKTIFARPKHIKVPCCKPCILAAKELHVDPRDPYPVIGNMIGSNS